MPFSRRKTNYAVPPKESVPPDLQHQSTSFHSPTKKNTKPRFQLEPHKKSHGFNDYNGNIQLKKVASSKQQKFLSPTSMFRNVRKARGRASGTKELCVSSKMLRRSNSALALRSAMSWRKVSSKLLVVQKARWKIPWDAKIEVIFIHIYIYIYI